MAASRRGRAQGQAGLGRLLTHVGHEELVAKEHGHNGHGAACRLPLQHLEPLEDLLVLRWQLVLRDPLRAGACSELAGAWGAGGGVCTGGYLRQLGLETRLLGQRVINGLQEAPLHHIKGLGGRTCGVSRSGACGGAGVGRGLVGRFWGSLSARPGQSKHLTRPQTRDLVIACVCVYVFV